MLHRVTDKFTLSADGASVRFPLVAEIFYPLRKYRPGSSLQRLDKPLAIIIREGFDEIRREENRGHHRRGDGYWR